MILEQQINEVIKWCSRFLLFTLIPLFGANGQRSFEFGNSKAITLDYIKLNQLTNTFWVSREQEMLVRADTLINSSKFIVSYIDYSKDQAFEFNGKFGQWALKDEKYIQHRLNDPKEEARLRFGGYFSVTELTDSTLTLVKLLTTSHDMKRSIYFKAASREEYFKPLLESPQATATPTFKKKKEMPVRTYKNLTPFLIEPDPKKFKRIGKLTTDELLHYGFDFKGDTVYLHIKDSLYKIERRVKE